MAIFKGSGVAIVTPMNPDYTINFEVLGQLIEFHIANQTDAIIICGTTGEASTLEDHEHEQAIKYTVEKVAKRVPVIAGTGSNSTAHAIYMSQFAESVGADACLCVTPYYNKCTQNGLIKHFNAIADSIQIPIILYSVPGRTGVNIQPKTVLELSKHPNIVALKEASGDIAQCCEIARLIPDDFALYSGNDDMIVPLLSLGGAGVISVVANIIPKETHDMVMKYLEGDTKEALRLQLEAKPLIDALFCEVNPIPVKCAVNMMGYHAGPVRLPLTEMEPANQERLKKEMAYYNLVK